MEFAVRTFLLIRGFYSERVIYSLKHIKSMCCSIRNTGFPGGASGKEPTCQCRRQKRHGFAPWIGKIPEDGHGNPLQFSYLENREA